MRDSKIITLFLFPGIIELNGSCSQLLLELLKNFMLNQNVMLSVKGVTKNVHAVSVEKCSENGTVSIADKLVTYGLAKHITSKKQSASQKGIFFRVEFTADVSVTKNRCNLFS